ncbi:Pumilio-12-like protein [Quillaja saponaria]|uniref:Pumilio-12-like protein n=1 Tax=Quillaja saponaria TaxID=32244 RepID=A0AAD7KUT2_QUISA|nr:Pumilio-12-like protein [Quillaja saponaria]
MAEKSNVTASATPNSSDSPIDKVTYFLQNLRVKLKRDDEKNESGTSSLGNNLVSSDSNASSNQPHRDFEQKHELRPVIPSVPTPLYPTGNFSALGVDRTSMSNWGSTSSRANEDNPFINNSTTSLLGERDYLMSTYESLQQNLPCQNSFVNLPPTIGKGGAYSSNGYYGSSGTGGFGWRQQNCNNGGSNSLKRLIKVLEKSTLVERVTSALSTQLYTLMTNPIGSNVILRCLEILDTQKNQVLYKGIIRDCLPLAIHETGCITLNRCISCIRGECRQELLAKISENSVFLSLDPSGNYVVQNVVELENPYLTQMICIQLKRHYLNLSTKKGGSHVVERCLNSCGMKYVIEEFLKSDKLGHIVKDQYGNYVIQTALKATKAKALQKDGPDSELYDKLLRKLESIPLNLQYGYGKNVANLIRERVPTSINRE